MPEANRARIQIAAQDIALNCRRNYIYSYMYKTLLYNILDWILPHQFDVRFCHIACEVKTIEKEPENFEYFLYLTTVCYSLIQRPFQWLKHYLYTVKWWSCVQNLNACLKLYKFANIRPQCSYYRVEKRFSLDNANTCVSVAHKYLSLLYIDFQSCQHHFNGFG